jgi:hypothetical protein
VKGSDLLEFIKKNNLENEEINIEYFSWERKQKYCGKCNCIVNLNRFHKGTSGLDPDKSSFYRYICRECLNKSAFHKKYKKKEELGL